MKIFMVSEDDLLAWRQEWMEQNPVDEGVDHVTPFDATMFRNMAVIGIPLKPLCYLNQNQVDFVKDNPEGSGVAAQPKESLSFPLGLVLESDARAALFSAITKAEQKGAFKHCVECGYQDGHDPICKFHESTRADQVLVPRVALKQVLTALVSAPHRIRELQATMLPEQLFPDNPINQLIHAFAVATAKEARVES